MYISPLLMRQPHRHRTVARIALCWLLLAPGLLLALACLAIAHLADLPARPLLRLGWWIEERILGGDR